MTAPADARTDLLMRRSWIAVALLLAGCAAWSKPGGDAAASDAAYRECRAVADGAVKTDTDIDQDISATRHADWQRDQLGRIAGEAMREPTRERAGRIVDSCMRAKGFMHAR